jgi:hypothetical protein
VSLQGSFARFKFGKYNFFVLIELALVIAKYISLFIPQLKDCALRNFATLTNTFELLLVFFLMKQLLLVVIGHL